MRQGATRFIAGIAAVGAIAAMAGCSTALKVPAEEEVTASASPSPDPTTNPACQLLTVEQIEQVTGLPFTQSAPEDVTVLTASNIISEDCQWVLPEELGDATVAVQYMEGLASSYAATKDVAQSTFGDAADVEVPGADKAFAFLGGEVIGMTVGDDYVQVTYTSFVDTTGKPALLAAAVAQALGGVPAATTSPTP